MKTYRTKTYRTKTGRIMTEADVEALTEEVVNADYDLDEVKARPGRPPMGTGPAEVVRVRFEPELRAELAAAAERESTSVSDLVRRAVRGYLGATG